MYFILIRMVVVMVEYYDIYIFEEEVTYSTKINYEDITEEWLHNSDTSIKEINDAKYVVKNGKRYYVNKRNKIIHKNREIENAKWYINLMGGKLQYLPVINEGYKVKCADYRYYPPQYNYLKGSGRQSHTFYQSHLRVYRPCL